MKYGKMTLGQIEALVNKLGGESVVDGILSEKLTVTVTAVANSILSFIGMIKLLAMKKFVARDNFQLDKTGIGYLGDNFKNWFLGKTEEPAPEVTLSYHRLTESLFDAPILAELGDKAETTLANLFRLLAFQPQGGKGVLVTKGSANVFYIKDEGGEFRTVYALWRGDGWFVDAFTTTITWGWRAGDRVFSRSPR